MHRLFYPRSVAVIGVSGNPDNLARIIIENLLEFQFQGEIFPVGKTEGRLLGKEILTSLEDLPQGIDVAVILTPSVTVPAILDACGRKKIRWAVVETGGFREYSRKGAQLEDEILQIARKWGIRIVGPNGLGLINLENGLVLPFLNLKRTSLRHGKLSILSQSGGVLLAYLNSLSSANVGIAKMVSMGNKLDLDEIDYLRYLLQDPQTDKIGLYLESLEGGRELMKIARSTSKPIIVHKANTAEGSRQIATYHTAALANDDKVVETALKQAGIIRVRDFRSFVNTAKILSLPAMRGNNLVIVTRSGGNAIVAADAADRWGFRLFPFTRAFQNQIHSYFRAKVIQPTNPLDLGDLFDFDLYIKILKRALSIKEVHGLLFQHGASGEERKPSRNLIRAVKDLSIRHQKPIAFCYLTDEEEKALTEKMADYPIFSEPEDALSALATSRDQYLRRKGPEPSARSHPAEYPRAKRLMNRAMKVQRDLSLPEALEVLHSYGISTTESREVRQKNDLKKAFEELKKPVALKIVSQEISHKSDVGGVVLNIDRLAEAESVFDRLKKLGGEKSSSVLVQEMVARGKEVILGAKRDPSFGPVILFGLGGIYTEIFQETSLRVAPFSRSEALEMLLESKASSILKGVRGERPVDLKALTENLLRLSQLMIDFPEIEGIDINPAIVSEKGTVAVDARIILGRTRKQRA